MVNLKAHLSLLGSSLIWACSFPLYNFVMPRYIEPLPLFTATILVTAIMSLSSLVEPVERLPRRDIISMVGAALLIAILRKGMLLFGLSMTSPIDGSIIGTIAPVVVLVISVIVGAERLSARKVMGVLLGFAGAIGVILSGGSGSGEQSQMVGNLMVLLCAFIAAIYMVWFKELLSRYRPTTVLRWMFCLAAIIFLPFGAHSLGAVDYHGWSTNVWLAVIYLVVMPTYIPNLLLTSGLAKVSPTISSIYTYMQPVGAVALSVAFGLDKLHLLTILFAMLIFSGVGLVIAEPKRG